MQQLRQLLPIRCGLVEQQQKFGVSEHQTGGIRAQTLFHILRCRGQRSAEFPEALPRTIKDLRGILVLEIQVHFINENPCEPPFASVGRNTILDHFQSDHKRGGPQPLSHFVQIDVDNAVAHIHIGLLGEDI